MPTKQYASDAPRPPKIAVVAASRRAARLAFLLEALAGQSLALAEFEVVIARDPLAGPEPPVPDGLQVTFLRAEGDERPGVGALRNLAWRAARAPIVAFTDDDCRPAPGWLEAILAAAGERLVLQGRTASDPDEAHLLHGLARSQQIAEPNGMFETCNMAYPRSLLEQLGGFDEGIGFDPGRGANRSHGGEDTDLALRAGEAGAEHRFVDDALVWHAVHTPTLRAALRFAWQWQGIGLVVKRHPQQRAALFARYFSQPSHALWLLGAAATAAPIGLLPALAGWLPYAAYRLGYRHLRRPSRTLRALVYLPQIAVVDAVEVGARIRESARVGALVL